MPYKHFRKNDKPGDSPFDDFGGSADQRVLQYTAGNDYATPDPYNMFRYLATSSVNGANHSLGEIELFGTVTNRAVPEPSTFALAALGLFGLASFFFARRRRK